MSTHHPRRSAQEQARLDATFTELCEKHIAFNQVLGLKIASLDGARGCSASFEMRPDLIGHRVHGRLHGGVTAAVLDAVAGISLMIAMSEKFAHEATEQIMHRVMKLGTIDLRVDYLRPGLGHRFVATAEVVRLGGRVGSTQMRLINEHGHLLATGAGAYIVS